MSEVVCEGPPELLAPAAEEPPLSFPAAVLALLVALDMQRLCDVARALEVPTFGSRGDVAMRVASEVARDPDGMVRLVDVLDAEELRRTCGEVLGLPADGDKAELVQRLAGWLALFLPPSAAGD